jgi:hypothetical protein
MNDAMQRRIQEICSLSGFGQAERYRQRRAQMC